jgi:hypothetical protein
MRSFRQKPVGWRGESYRHYLASKGIKTRVKQYFFPKQSRVGALDRARILLRKESELMKKWKAGVEGSGLTEEEMYELQGVQTEVNGILSELNQSQRDILRIETKDTYDAAKSDFVKQGGRTFFVDAENQRLVNVNDPEDILSTDERDQESFRQDMSALSNMGVIPWEAQGAVFGAAAEPMPMYARKKSSLKVHGVPIKVSKVTEGRVFPVTPEKVKAVLGKMPKNEVKGMKAVEFVDPKGDQEHAWAQYVRGSKVMKIFSQPSDGVMIDGQCPRKVQMHMEEYVLPHEVGHHRALRGGKTDKSLAVAEARADANVVGMDPFDRDVRSLVK